MSVGRTRKKVESLLGERGGRRFSVCWANEEEG